MAESKKGELKRNSIPPFRHLRMQSSPILLVRNAQNENPVDIDASCLLFKLVEEHVFETTIDGESVVPNCLLIALLAPGRDSRPDGFPSDYAIGVSEPPRASLRIFSGHLTIGDSKDFVTGRPDVPIQPIAAGSIACARDLLLARLNPQLAVSMPLPVMNAINSLFVDSASPAPKQLAASCGVSKQTLDRWIRRGGIASTRRLFASARIAWTYDAAHQPNAQVDAIPILLGYPSSRSLQRQCIAMTGMTLSRLFCTVSTAKLVAILSAALIA